MYFIAEGTYPELIKSIVDQFQKYPKLRLAAFRGALDFAAFSIFWTTMVFLLQGEPFKLGSNAAGAMGLVGIAGAVVASFVGKLSDRMSKSKLIIIGAVAIMISWVIIGFSYASLIGLIIGAFVLDLGVQSVHITNQTIIFEDNPKARNRINTVYMVLYFTGGALGTFIGGYIWYYFKWTGISIAGIVISFVLIAVHLIGEKLIQPKKIT